MPPVKCSYLHRHSFLAVLIDVCTVAIFNWLCKHHFLRTTTPTKTLGEFPRWLTVMVIFSMQFFEATPISFLLQRIFTELKCIEYFGNAEIVEFFR